MELCLSRLSVCPIHFTSSVLVHLPSLFQLKLAYGNRACQNANAPSMRVVLRSRLHLRSEDRSRAPSFFGSILLEWRRSARSLNGDRKGEIELHREIFSLAGRGNRLCVVCRTNTDRMQPFENSIRRRNDDLSSSGFFIFAEYV